MRLQESNFMEWLFRLGYLFILIWTFGLATNGVKRNQIILVGGLGSVFVLLASIVASIFTHSLLFVGVLIEMVVVFFILLALFGWIFRKVSKPDNSGIFSRGETPEQIIKRLRK